MTRHEVRENAFLLLFMLSFDDDSNEINYEDIELSEYMKINDAVKELVDGVFAHKAEIDDIISKYSPRRIMSRIARINIVILELAIYESIYDAKTPVNSAISEAVKLIENYSYDENDKKFINGVLGSFSKFHFADVGDGNSDAVTANVSDEKTGDKINE
jgi:N utilization substance protein B